MLGVMANTALGDPIPEGNTTITTASRKGTEHRVESEGVDRVDHIDAILCGLAVTLESIFTSLGFRRRVEPLDCDTTLNTGRDISSTVGHAGNAPCHEPQAAL